MTQPNDLKPQLKKMDFLKILTSDPTPLAEIKEKLAETHRFVPSYLDYLADHFAGQGRVTIDEDGNVSLASRAASTSIGLVRDLYKVEEIDDGEFRITKLGGNTAKAAAAAGLVSADQGWATTISAAVKRENSKNFARYKERAVKISGLLESEAAPAELVLVGDQLVEFEPK